MCNFKYFIMERIIFFLFIFFVTDMIFAQNDTAKALRNDSVALDTLKTGDTTKLWDKGGVLTISLSQVSLTNWVAGGQSSISGTGALNLYANYKKNKSTWDNTLELTYGLVKQGDESVRKSDDKIDFSSKYGRNAFKHWYYSFLLGFKSQMTPGYNYPNDSVMISNFLAPGYIIPSLGMDFKPDDNFSLFMSPLSGKITIVSDEALADTGAFGVEEAFYNILGILVHGKNFKGEFGSYLKVFWKKNIMENITLETNLDLFSNYLENPENIDVSFEMHIIMNINEWLTTDLNCYLLYDDDVDIEIDTNNDGIIDEKGPRTQFKEVLSVGFTIKF